MSYFNHFSIESVIQFFRNSNNILRHVYFFWKRCVGGFNLPRKFNIQEIFHAYGRFSEPSTLEFPLSDYID